LFVIAVVPPGIVTPFGKARPDILSMKHPNELQPDLWAIGEAVARLTVIHVAKNTAARASIILIDLESIIFLKLFESDEMKLTSESHPLLKPQFLEDVIVRLYSHSKKSVTATTASSCSSVIRQKEKQSNSGLIELMT
jgi:hypothetical protein